MMSKCTRVYVVQDDPKKNFRDHLSRYGEVRYVFPADVNPFSTDQLMAMAREVLSEAEPTDYFVPAGPSALLCVACMVWAQVIGRAELLLWSHPKGHYVHRSTHPGE